MNKICVVGLGYIGLPTAAMFAKSGYEVVGVDVDEKVVSSLNEGNIHIGEPGISELVKSLVSDGKLKASLIAEEADNFIIAVPTPINEDYKADLSYVEAAVEGILPYLKKGNNFIVESTIPPRTIEDLVCPILKRSGLVPGEDLFISHCPERVLPGRIITELVENNRIVGGINEQSADKAVELYNSFVKGEIFKTDATTAEMSKLMENTFRDVNIALANELVKISKKLNVNALEVVKLANKHPRVNLHTPGPGVGGHCIALDPYFIVDQAPEEAQLIAISRAINSSMPSFVIKEVKDLVSNGAKIAVLGLAYKGNTDDIRESPAVEIVSLLNKEGYEVSICDPQVENQSYNLLPLGEAVRNSELILILTDHDEFKEFDFSEINHCVKQPVILDTKNCIKQPGSFELKKLGNYGKHFSLEIN